MDVSMDGWVGVWCYRVMGLVGLSKDTGYTPGLPSLTRGTASKGKREKKETQTELKNKTSRGQRQARPSSNCPGLCRLLDPVRSGLSRAAAAPALSHQRVLPALKTAQSLELQQKNLEPESHQSWLYSSAPTTTGLPTR